MDKVEKIEQIIYYLNKIYPLPSSLEESIIDQVWSAWRDADHCMWWVMEDEIYISTPTWVCDEIELFNLLGLYDYRPSDDIEYHDALDDYVRAYQKKIKTR